MWTLQEFGSRKIKFFSIDVQVYEQVGEAFAKFNDKVVIAKVDADAHKELGSRFEVRGFPTLKFFPKGSTNPEE